MTAPRERTRAVIELGRAVEALRPYAFRAMPPSSIGMVLVPQDTLRTLVLWMRHYPLPSEIAATAAHCPHLWADPDEVTG